MGTASESSSEFVVIQMDVFNTFIELLRQTGNVTKGKIDMNESRQVSVLLCMESLPYIKIIYLNFSW